MFPLTAAHSRSPATVTGTSLSPGSLLELFRGYGQSAFTPRGILEMSSESRKQPLMMMPFAHSLSNLRMSCESHQHPMKLMPAQPPQAQDSAA